MVLELRAQPDGRGLKVGIAVARFNEVVTGRLLQGALAACRACGVADTDITVVHVPGAFELPQASAWLATKGRCDAVAALGAVIRGETSHYDYVCSAATDGCLRVNLDTNVPIAFGVLTCEDLAQAMARAGGDAGNKGNDAVLAALEMAQLSRALEVAMRKPQPPR
jgi:6,7-dimethyl-8-ribityllumazine synthase